MSNSVWTRRALWGSLFLVATFGCGVIGFVENPAPLTGPAYWAAATGTPAPTVTLFLGTTTPVVAATAVPGEITTTPEWTTVTPLFLSTPTPYWVTTTPLVITTTPDGSPPVTTTLGLPMIGYTTPAPLATPYYRLGTFYMNSDVYVGGPNGLVFRLTGHETQPSPNNEGANYHYFTLNVTNYTGTAAIVPITDVLFIRRVQQDDTTLTGRWTPQNEPLLVRSLPAYDTQQLTPILPDETRTFWLGFVVPDGAVSELGLITNWNRPVEGGLPVWFYLADDPLGPFDDALQPPLPTPVVLDDGGTFSGGGGGEPGSGAGGWPTTGIITRGFGCHELYTGIDGTGFGCPPERQWFHNGVDIANSQGTLIWSPVAGNIVYAGPNSTGPDCSDIPGSQPPHEGLGNYQRISGSAAGGASTLHYFGHLSGFLLTSGAVEAGQLVAEMGSTGCSTGSHLHWTLYQNGSLIDPAQWAGPGPNP